MNERKFKRYFLLFIFFLNFVTKRSQLIVILDVYAVCSETLLFFCLIALHYRNINWYFLSLNQLNFAPKRVPNYDKIPLRMPNPIPTPPTTQPPLSMWHIKKNVTCNMRDIVNYCSFTALAKILCWSCPVHKYLVYQEFRSFFLFFTPT